MRTFIPLVLILLGLVVSPAIVAADDDRPYIRVKFSTWDGGGPYYSDHHDRDHKRHSRHDYDREHKHHSRHDYDRHRANSRDYQRHLVINKRGHLKRHTYERVVWTPPPRVFYKTTRYINHQPCNLVKKTYRRLFW